ncbi:MAG: hypothetical protein ABI877_21295 [Gemmatimonadaceae bacterium]
MPEFPLEREDAESPASPVPLPRVVIRVADAAAYASDDGVEPLGPDSFSLSVDGVPLTVVIDEERLLARIISPLFPANVFAGDLMTASNQMNAEHIAFGYTHMCDREVRYAMELLIDPFHSDQITVALEIAASISTRSRLTDARSLNPRPGITAQSSIDYGLSTEYSGGIRP